MVRKPISPSNERILVRQINYLPEDLERQETFPERITLGTDIQLTLSQLNGLFGQTNKLVHTSTFNELLVAQGGSGLDAYDEVNGTAPDSFDSTNEISRDSGYKRFDVLVRGENAEIEPRLLNGTFGDVIKLNPGRYSFDLNIQSLRIRKEGSTAGTYQLLGWFTSNLDNS